MSLDEQTLHNLCVRLCHGPRQLLTFLPGTEKDKNRNFIIRYFIRVGERYKNRSMKTYCYELSPLRHLVYHRYWSLDAEIRNLLLFPNHLCPIPETPSESVLRRHLLHRDPFSWPSCYKIQETLFVHYRPYQTIGKQSLKAVALNISYLIISHTDI